MGCTHAGPGMEWFDPAAIGAAVGGGLAAAATSFIQKFRAQKRERGRGQSPSERLDASVCETQITIANVKLDEARDTILRLKDRAKELKEELEEKKVECAEMATVVSGITVENERLRKLLADMEKKKSELIEAIKSSAPVISGTRVRCETPTDGYAEPVCDEAVCGTVALDEREDDHT